MKINTISPDTSEYLQMLTNIAKPPKKLHYIGTLPNERRITVALVGSRRPTAYGREVTYRLAYDLAQQGIVVISGLALGVDAIAHQASLDAHGTTIAVLGNGLPEIRPMTNRATGEQIIAEGGAILTEYANHTTARANYFLERNRIVSGLSDAIIITEASLRSGTLNTAAHALEQGKEVFVVPGNITSPLSAGCNALLKQGARVATSYTDVLEVVRPQDEFASQTSLALGETELETNIITLLKEGMRDGEEMQRSLAADPTEFATSLTMLELRGVIRALGANQWTLN